MRVRWTPAAADDFENIANYLFEQTPENAARLIREIYSAPKGLESFPKRGRVGKKDGSGVGATIPAIRDCLSGHIRKCVHPARPSRFAGLAVRVVCDQ